MRSNCTLRVSPSADGNLLPFMVTEVSSALVTITKQKEAHEQIVKQVEKMKKAVEYNQDLMLLSTTTYLEVLNAQQSLLSSQIALVNNELQNNQAAINLYQALGGGR